MNSSVDLLAVPLGVSEQGGSPDNVATRTRIRSSPSNLTAANREVHGTGSVKIYPAPGYTGDGGYVQVNSDCGMGASGNDLCGPWDRRLEDRWHRVLQAPKINVHGSCQSGSAPLGILDEAAAQIGDPLSGLLPPRFDPALDGAKCGVTSQTTLANDTNRQGCGSAKMPWKFSLDSDCPVWGQGSSALSSNPACTTAAGDRDQDPRETRSGDLHHRWWRDHHQISRRTRFDSVGRWGSRARAHLQYGQPDGDRLSKEQRHSMPGGPRFGDRDKQAQDCGLAARTSLVRRSLRQAAAHSVEW